MMPFCEIFGGNFSFRYSGGLNQPPTAVAQVRKGIRDEWFVAILEQTVGYWI